VSADSKLPGAPHCDLSTLQPALIDYAYERLVEAIADGTLAPASASAREELGRGAVTKTESRERRIG